MENLNDLDLEMDDLEIEDIAEFDDPNLSVVESLISTVSDSSIALSDLNNKQIKALIGLEFESKVYHEPMRLAYGYPNVAEELKKIILKFYKQRDGHGSKIVEKALGSSKNKSEEDNSENEGD